MTSFSDRVTVRGCTTRQEQNDYGKHASNYCKSNKCNGKIFPEDRLSCLHCAGNSCVNQTNTVDVRYPCINYHPDDMCYSVFSTGKSIEIFLNETRLLNSLCSLYNFIIKFKN